MARSYLKVVEFGGSPKEQSQMGSSKESLGKRTGMSGRSSNFSRGNRPTTPAPGDPETEGNKALKEVKINKIFINQAM